MLCKNPFLRKPTGEIKALAKVDPEARLALTPFPCGQCLHCRINLSRIWSTRIKMERDLHKESLFVTLTYNDDFLPTQRGCQSLNPTHYTNFLKKFRKEVYPRKIRTFGVGEYGKISNRPHYHVVIFNSEFGDERVIQNSWGETDKKSQCWQSYGFVDTDVLTDGLSNYIAGYIVDKLVERGQIDTRVCKPFMRASKGTTRSMCAKYKGGIGAGYAYYCGYEINKNEWIGPEDITNMVYGHKKVPIGRYLTNIIAHECGIDPKIWEIKNERYYDDLLDSIYQQVQSDDENPQKSPYKEKGKAITYYDSIRAKFKQKRLVREKRHKIYQSRNKI